MFLHTIFIILDVNYVKLSDIIYGKSFIIFLFLQHYVVHNFSFVLKQNNHMFMFFIVIFYIIFTSYILIFWYREFRHPNLKTFQVKSFHKVNFLACSKLETIIS